MTEKKILRAVDVCTMLGISGSCFNKWLAKGAGPEGDALRPKDRRLSHR